MKKLLLLLIALLVLPICAGELSHRRKAFRTSAGVGTSPGTGSLLGWYDFADAQDAHSTNADLVESSTAPTYDTSGGVTYGIADDTGDAHWTLTLGSWPNDTTTDKSWAIRIRWRTAIPTANALNRGPFRDMLIGNANDSMTVVLGSTASGITTSILSPDTWYTIVVTRDFDTTMEVWLDGVSQGTANPTATSSSGGWFLGATDATGAIDVDIDWFCLYTKVLTVDNALYLNNSGATRSGVPP